jgi:hypothetical protein
MNSFSIRLTWLGLWHCWRPELRVITDRSTSRKVGLELIWLGFNLGFLSYDFRLSNWQAGCHVAQHYFAS